MKRPNAYEGLDDSTTDATSAACKHDPFGSMDH